MQKSQEKAAVLFSIRTKFQAPSPEHKHSAINGQLSMGEGLVLPQNSPLKVRGARRALSAIRAHQGDL